ncbi:MAG: type VI secretion system lipoprotein TssJ [Rhodospirillales bacterium]
MVSYAWVVEVVTSPFTGAAGAGIVTFAITHVGGAMPVRSICLASLCAAAALLAGCSSPPPPPPPTVLNLTMKAASGVNPGPDGQPAPVVLRVYQLETAAGFNNAEFFPLYNTDSTVLGQDLVKREDVVLAPGATVSKTIMPKDQVKALGLFAGFRDFQHLTWRGSTDVAANKTTNVTVTVGPAGVAVEAAPAPPPAKPAS